jgi:hypothetical protein
VKKRFVFDNITMMNLDTGYARLDLTENSMRLRKSSLRDIYPDELI